MVLTPAKPRSTPGYTTGAAVLVGLGYAAWIIWLLSGR
jgi:hypothetical protein